MEGLTDGQTDKVNYRVAFRYNSYFERLHCLSVVVWLQIGFIRSVRPSENVATIFCKKSAEPFKTC